MIGSRMVGRGGRMVGRILETAMAHPGMAFGGMAVAGALAETHLIGRTSHAFQQAGYGDPYAFRRFGTAGVAAHLGVAADYQTPDDRLSGPPNIADAGVKRIGSRPPWSQYQSPYSGPDGSVVFGMYNTRM